MLDTTRSWILLLDPDKQQRTHWADCILHLSLRRILFSRGGTRSLHLFRGSVPTIPPGSWHGVGGSNEQLLGVSPLTYLPMDVARVYTTGRLWLLRMLEPGRFCFDFPVHAGNHAALA